MIFLGDRKDLHQLKSLLCLGKAAKMMCTNSNYRYKESCFREKYGSAPGAPKSELVERN